jgi:glycosyltransferase involved in cell wall biosynthesis
MKNLNIAMVAATAFPANHGSAASIKEMSKELARRGHKVHIVTYPSDRDINLKGVIIHRISLLGKSKKIKIGPNWRRPIWDILLALKLIKIIWDENIDVIHAHNYESALAGWIAKLFTRKPLLFNAVTNMIDELPTYGFIKPYFIAVMLARMLDYLVPRMANEITVVSHELEEFYQSKGIKPERITYVPPGVELSMFENANGNIVREKLELNHNALILYTGVLNHFQGVDSLFDAFKIVAEQHKNTFLIVLANMVEDGQMVKYKKLAASLGIKEQVIFVKNKSLSQLPHYLYASDVAVSPRSVAPGFPVKLLNYMACGRPIVSFKGSAKCLKDGYNGIVVENHDSEAFAHAILQLLENPTLAKRLAKNAKKTLIEEFMWKNLVDKIETVYGQLL